MIVFHDNASKIFPPKPVFIYRQHTFANASGTLEQFAGCRPDLHVPMHPFSLSEPCADVPSLPYPCWNDAAHNNLTDYSKAICKALTPCQLREVHAWHWNKTTRPHRHARQRMCRPALHFIRP